MSEKDPTDAEALLAITVACISVAPPYDGCSVERAVDTFRRYRRALAELEGEREEKERELDPEIDWRATARKERARAEAAEEHLDAHKDVLASVREAAGLLPGDGVSLVGFVRDLVARANSGEERSKMLLDAKQYWKARAEAAEARVAELKEKVPAAPAIPPMPTPSGPYHVGPNDPIRHRSRAWRQMDAYLRQFPGAAAQLDPKTLAFLRSVAAGEQPLPETCAEYVAPKPEAFSESTKCTKFVVEFPSREAAEEQARKAAAWEHYDEWEAILDVPSVFGWLANRLENKSHFAGAARRIRECCAIATGAAPIPGKEAKS